LQHIRPDHGEADDIARAIRPGMRIIDMVAAKIIAGGGDALPFRRQHLDDLIALERIADAHRPGPAFAVDALALDVAARLDAEIAEAHAQKLPRRVADRPALDHAAGIDGPVRAGDVEIAAGLPPCLFAQRHDLPQARREILFTDLAAIETGNLAVVPEGTELRIHGAKFREHRVQILRADASIRHGHGDGHAHDAARLTHGSNASQPA